MLGDQVCSMYSPSSLSAWHLLVATGRRGAECGFMRYIADNDSASRMSIGTQAPSSDEGRRVDTQMLSYSTVAALSEGLSYNLPTPPS
jgi:hypothetical protein